MSGSRFQLALFTFLFPVAASTCLAADLEWVKVSDDGKGFVLASGRPFTPSGFNYDHDGPGRLIEDYWDDEWPMVVEDFREMKELGASVVRIHLQFGKFMDSPGKPNQHSLQQLDRLVKLAEQVGLYLDLTGLGCYHKKDVPPWYDKLEEEERWAAQSAFWEAIAKTCADSPAIFCYDLMNEPVVGEAKKRDDWLGGAFAGKHFVQFIVLETKGRPRHEIARQWTNQLVAAIRKHDRKHLVTVGLVHWSLDRPGLTSGFVPEKIADELDFIAIHIYPEKGKVDEALETVKGFAAVGKPVVIEETFVLKCSQDEMSRFIDESKSVASGWISFYWGKTPEECRKGGTIGEAIMANWLELFPKRMAQIQSPFENVKCDGTYRHHLQGICTNDRDAIYWSFTTALVKTNTKGKVLKQIPVGNHHGDLCHVDGKIYVAVNFGRFNDPNGNADSWVYIYDADDLSLLAKHETQEVFHGAGGIGFRNGHFFVVGGLPDAVNENYVYEYDGKFEFVKRHVIKSGHTRLGIQTAAFANDQWWFGCYGDPKILLVTDADFKMKGRYEFDCSLGIVGLPDGRFLSASGRCEKDKGCWGAARLAVADDRRGLTTIDEP
ncbi:MAG: cellulase family glycosylhydrolase [Pirellulaceae bacterium]|nr:cellulase family glycosylhydrolase [Pirellulaceae bacterium]